MDLDIKPRGTRLFYSATPDANAADWTELQEVIVEMKEPERMFPAKIQDSKGNAHYFEIPESELRNVLKNIQDVLGDIE